MELTKGKRRYLTDHGITLLDEYLKSKGVMHDDIMIEIKDHNVISIEEYLNEHRNSGYDIAMREVHKKMGGTKTLRKTVRSRQKQLRKYWNKRIRQFMWSYLTWPKLMMTIFILSTLISVSFWATTNKQAVSIIITPEILVMIGSYLIIRHSVAQSSNQGNWHSPKGQLWTYECFIQAASSALLLLLPINSQQLLINIWGEQPWTIPVVLIVGIIATTYFILKTHAFHTQFKYWIIEELENKYPEHLDLIKA